MSYYYYANPFAKVQYIEEEYRKFKRCLPQLMDSGEITGDMTDRWVIFKDGWVYGLSSYESEIDALRFADQFFVDERESPYIIARVNIEDHGVSPLELLGNALSELEDEVED